ncbi:DUF1479-domain-containing protein [Xylona heveae TC161]|uniref:DUF1479-domain-containing protein n=1 Tax=Xylona heveae (strain CBS 132557 / TC161) TaxID=1328760 RepID=A0A164ZV04_XYLHT|nr:DUF1479-domain-containing protein [Xylona heveae TC161]KZF19567.1 DUF1479-domain-containing protein [Xylona heveae TC161]
MMQKTLSKCSISLRNVRPPRGGLNTPTLRCIATQAEQTPKPVHLPKKEGDISSVFVSLSSGEVQPLPHRFADLKSHLLGGNADQLKQSWDRLLKALRREIKEIAELGSNVIPEIDYRNIKNAPQSFETALRKRGVAVIRGVIPRDEARRYKEEVEDYVKLNPWTKAFPQNDPQVFELYWSPSQVRARAQPNLIEAQRYLLSFWHSNDPEAMISSVHPLSYADRLRIRHPGDAGFALGPHIDGGSVERWEPNGYGRGKVYEKILQGRWEEYDPWESSCRLAAVSDLYEGAGACSMFRMFQGWLSMSTTAPNEGTLLVNPLFSLSISYVLLRPFFAPRSPPTQSESAVSSTDSFLSPENWTFESQPSSLFQGAHPGHSQELNAALHPHLELAKSMVHVPKVEPGDYVVWHCDTIHAVDKVHNGKLDSSVMYIPACPLTESNAEYLSRQRDNFLRGTPAPDFPGGKGESEHTGRPSVDELKKYADAAGLRAFGFKEFDVAEPGLAVGQKKMLHRANGILGFE